MAAERLASDRAHIRRFVRHSCEHRLLRRRNRKFAERADQLGPQRGARFVFQASGKLRGDLLALRRGQVAGLRTQRRQIGHLAVIRRGPPLVVGPLLANPRVEIPHLRHRTVGAARERKPQERPRPR